MQFFSFLHYIIIIRPRKTYDNAFLIFIVYTRYDSNYILKTSSRFTLLIPINYNVKFTYFYRPI